MFIYLTAYKILFQTADNPAYVRVPIASMSQPVDYIAKLVCIGDSGTGKSSVRFLFYLSVGRMAICPLFPRSFIIQFNTSMLNIQADIVSSRIYLYT